MAKSQPNAPTPTGAKLVEKVVKQGNEFGHSYEKYVLPSGLTLIVHEDHSDPLVHVDVTYHVGSAREEIGKSGFAHFYEHMMFAEVTTSEMTSTSKLLLPLVAH